MSSFGRRGVIVLEGLGTSVARFRDLQGASWLSNFDASTEFAVNIESYVGKSKICTMHYTFAHNFSYIEREREIHSVCVCILYVCIFC